MNDESTGDEVAAMDALDRLGFGANEAKVLIGLHKIGTATAREISRVTDVARPQIYNAIEPLEQHGLVNVQQASPKRFQPVSPEETHAILLDQFEADIERVTEYLADMTAQRTEPAEEREDIWTVRGREAVTTRCLQLVKGASERVVFGVKDPSLLTAEIVDALREVGAAGIDVVVISSSPAIRDEFADDPAVTVRESPRPSSDRDYTGRLVLVDDDTVLHSVLGEDELPGIPAETAYWSADTGFASTLTTMMEQFMASNGATDSHN